MNYKQYIRVILIFVLFLSSNLGFAQSFKLYAQGGIIASQVDGDKYGGYKKPGIFGGLAVAYPINADADMMLEINYIELGARKNPNLDVGDYTKYLLRANYIQVPVFYRYNLHRYLSIDGGLSYSTLISSKQFDAFGEVPIPDPQLRKFDVGAIFGFSFHFNDQWSSLLRWSYSVIPFRDHASGASFRFNRGKYHNYINLSAQYAF